MQLKDRFYAVALCLYVTSLFCSIAGMEGFACLLGLSVLCTTVVGPEAQPRFRSLVGFKALDWSLIVLAFAIILSGLFSEASTFKSKFDVVGQFRWVLILYALTALAMNYVQLMEKIFSWILVLTILIGSYCAIQSMTGIDPFRKEFFLPHKYSDVFIWRAKGFFSNTMSYAYSMSMLFCVLVAALFSGYTKSKGQRFHLLSIAATTIAAISIILTVTRGAWLALAVALPAMLLVASPKKGFKILLPTCLVAALLIFTVQPLKERVLSIANTKEQSNSQRFDLWRVNWQMFLDHPLIGVGYGENSTRTPEYNQSLFGGKKHFVANAHNNVLQTLGGIGLLGFVPWLIFGAILLWVTARAVWQGGLSPTFFNTILVGSLGAQVVMHVGGLTQATFYDKEVQHMFLFQMALTFMALNMTKSLGEQK